MISDSRLMSCPFCGGYVHQDASATYFRENMLYCEWCGMYFALDALDATEDALETVFNTRCQDRPVKPIIDDECRCGNCAHKLTQQQKFGDNVIFVEKFDYCPACGRKVDWSEQL